MADTTCPLVELGRRPIAPDAPCGISARYEPEYEYLEAEIAKLGTPTAQPVDWGRVIDLGTTVLKDKSKDLLVASYLGCGLFEQQGYAGLETGFIIYRDLLAAYWDTLFPEKRRLRARLAAITWLAERLASALERRARDLERPIPVASEYDVVQRCEELVRDIGALLDEKLSDRPSTERQQLLGPLPGRLAKLRAGIEPPPPPPPKDFSLEITTESDADKALQHSPPPPPPKDFSLEITTESDADKALQHCQTSFRNAAAFLLSKNLANPLPYRLNRLGTWLLVLQPPALLVPQPPEKNGVTLVPSVQPEMDQRCKDALQRGEYASLILEVEASFARAPFWFNAHCYTAMALDALGPTHAQARRAVIDELASFLARIPGVLDLKFADGTTPFADDQTRLWIESEVRPPSQERHAVTPVASTDNGAQTPPWVQVTQEAKQLAAKGRVIEGVALLQTGQQQAASQRERFLWRLQQARFCAEAGLLEVAIPQLEFLGEQAEHFALEEWEPRLSLEVVQLLLQCYYRLKQKTPSPPAELVEKAQRLHARLCRLDVTAVLALDGKT
jgi:type VI secretion system protein VasJ